MLQVKKNIKQLEPIKTHQEPIRSNRKLTGTLTTINKN